MYFLVSFLNYMYMQTLKTAWIFDTAHLYQFFIGLKMKSLNTILNFKAKLNIL